MNRLNYWYNDILLEISFVPVGYMLDLDVTTCFRVYLYRRDFDL